jgi:hypothetical protein
LPRPSVDYVDEHVADQRDRAVDGDPRPPAFRVAGRHLRGGRLVVRHLGKPDVATPFAGEAHPRGP